MRFHHAVQAVRAAESEAFDECMDFYLNTDAAETGLAAKPVGCIDIPDSLKSLATSGVQIDWSLLPHVDTFCFFHMARFFTYGIASNIYDVYGISKRFKFKTGNDSKRSQHLYLSSSRRSAILPGS